MRSLCTAVVFTSVGVDDVVRFIRDKAMYRVRLTRLSDALSRAVGYRVYITPLMEPIVKRVFEDRVRLDLPSWVRERYEEKRREALQRLMSEMDAAAQRAKQLELEAEEPASPLDLAAQLQRALEKL